MNDDFDVSVLEEFDQCLFELLRNHPTVPSSERTRQAVRELVSEYTGPLASNAIFREGPDEECRALWEYWWDPDELVVPWWGGRTAGLSDETAGAAQDVWLELATVAKTPLRPRNPFADAFTELRKAAEDYLELRGKSHYLLESNLPISIDEAEWTVTRNGETAEFRGKEIPWKLFLRLLRASARVVPYKGLLKAGWTDQDIVIKDNIGPHITTIRKLLEPVGLKVKNHTNHGYSLADSEKDQI